MSDYIKMYFADDDTVVSEEGTFVNSIDFTLRADLEESDEVRLYVKCEDDYESTSTEVIPVGTSAARWALAPDVTGPASGTYGDGGAKIELGTVDDTTKVYFWAKASALNTETPINDVSVTLKLEGIIASTA